MLVSLLLLGYNSESTLVALRESLQQQTSDQYEVIAFDNASADRTPELLQTFPKLAYFARSSANLGYAAGMNGIARRATGDIIVPLNADVELDPNFILGLTRRFAEGAAVVSPLVWRDRSKSHIDGAIITVGRDMRSVHHPVASAEIPMKQTGPCPALSSDLINRLRSCRGNPIFDDTIFDTYGEDIDLALRLAELGEEIVFAPEVIAFHSRSGSTGEVKASRKVGRTRTNIVAARYSNALLHLPGTYLCRILPLLAIQDCGMLAVRLFQGDRHVLRDVWKAWVHTIRSLGETLRRRRLFPPSLAVARRLEPARFYRGRHPREASVD